MILTATLLFFVFVHLSLLIPGFVFVYKTRLLAKQPTLELCAAYTVSIIFFGLLATARYVLAGSLSLLAFVGWLVLLVSAIIFVKEKLYRDVWKLRLPLLFFVLMSLLSCAFISLHYNKPYKYIPDPGPRDGTNYQVLNVKVLNVAQTNANDNYIPYRQAQFFINRSDPAKDDFIAEWGVGFFQRTPLMGAVAGGYFIVLGEHPPIGYLWNSDSPDPDHSYVQFQVLAQILNALLILPGFFLIKRFFGKPSGVIASLFIVTSQYFLYSAFFTWPKSLVAFLILLSWLLLLERGRRYVVLAAIAGGVAYLAHDLAVLYIGASLVWLVYQKRWSDTALYAVISFLFALPWLIVASLIYKKPSTFILYPFSLHGLPQPGQSHQIIQEFLHTSPLELVSIRLDTIYYLLSPYQLIYSEGGQAILRRLWAVGLYPISGSVGLGLLVPAVMGFIKKIKKLTMPILVLTPVISAAIIFGWRPPTNVGSLHFAQPIVILLVGLGVWWLTTLKSKFWLYLAFVVNVIQLVFFILYSYGFNVAGWMNNSRDIALIILILAIISCCLVLFRQSLRPKHHNWLLED